MKKTKECSICLQKIKQYTRLVCGHCFHHQCIKILFCIYLDDKCPLCKHKYTYQPSRKRKSTQRLRKKIIDRNKNCCDRISRDNIIKLRQYFMKRKIYISFLEKIVDILNTQVSDNINYIEYTNKWIYLYERERHYQDGLIIAICNDPY